MTKDKITSSDIQVIQYIGLTMLVLGYIDNCVFWMMVGAVTFLYQLYKNQLSRKAEEGKGRRDDLAKIPGPMRLPYFGTTWIYFMRYKSTKVHEAYQDMLRRYGGVVREVVSSGASIISVSSREDIEKVLRYPSRYPYRPPSKIIMDYRRLRPERFSSAGISNEQGEVWHNLRSKLTPELTSKRTMLGFLPELNQIADDFMHLLKSNRNEDFDVLNFDALSCRYGLETACTLVFGERMTLMEEVVSDTALRLSRALMQRFKSERDEMYCWRDYTKTAEYAAFLRGEEELYSIVANIVQKARMSKENSHTEVKSILMSVVQRTDIDEREKESALIDFVAAGILTLSNSLNFLLYLVGRTPGVQERVYAELEEIAPNSNHITGADLARMPYTKACMLEAFRLIPVAFGLGRVLEEDTVLSGYHVRAGTYVMCHTMAACRSERNFQRAGEYLPERWLEGAGALFRESQAAAAHCVFAPFGVGKRMCPGKRSVEQGLLVTFAKMIREFHIEYDGELDVQFEFVLSPKTPVKFRLRDRC